MVWKIIKFLKKIRYILILLLSILLLSKKVFAAEVYPDGNISSSYTTYFQDILNGLPADTTYVYYRSGQYTYAMVVGNLALSNNVISSSEPVTIYEISTNSGSSYNSVYRYYVRSESNFSLNIGSSLVYTNLGDYPVLEERGDIFESALLFIFIIFCLCCFIRSWFKFTYRTRVSIH